MKEGDKEKRVTVISYIKVCLCVCVCVCVCLCVCVGISLSFPILIAIKLEHLVNTGHSCQLGRSLNNGEHIQALHSQKSFRLKHQDLSNHVKCSDVLNWLY